jgi:hypothetical protein
MNDVPLLDDQGNLIGRVNDSHVNARGELVGTAHIDKVGMDILCNVWKVAGCLTAAQLERWRKKEEVDTVESGEVQQ